MKVHNNGISDDSGEGERKLINSELWHACVGPLVSLPPVGSLVGYFPQGHSEQVAASMQKDTDSIPGYPSLPSKLICVLHNVTLHADAETDEVYAQMTLQPVNKYDKEALLASDMGLKQNKQPAEFFCKTLTASDTSSHGGFSVPRRAAEKIFPPLDFSMQPPAQELVARDLHDVAWTFRHIYRGQPKRHLLTTGWSVFVSTKRLFTGDSVLFIRDEISQLLLGIRRANRQQPALSSSVISSDSMHIGILAAAAHAAASNSPFTIFYNPRASPSEFVVPLAKYNKAMYTQVSLGMRFRMMFETEESGVHRYMGTVTGISDLDPVRWKSSQWRNLQVGWDESAAGERPSRVSIWDIEPVATPFYICPPPFFRPKFSNQPGVQDHESDVENAFKSAMPWLGDDLGGIKDPQNPMFPGSSLVQWMSMQQNPQFPSMISSSLHNNNLATDDPSKIRNFQSHASGGPGVHFDIPKTDQQSELLPQSSLVWAQQQQQRHHQLQNLGINPQQQQPQQHQLHPQQQQNEHHQQQLLRTASISSGLGTPAQILDQNLQKPLNYSQVQQQLPASNTPSQQNFHNGSQNHLLLSSTPQDVHFQRQLEQHQSLLQRQQQQQHNAQLQPLPLSQHELQLQLLQSQVSPRVQPQVSPQQRIHQQSPQLQQHPPLQQSQLGSVTNFSQSLQNRQQHFPANHLQGQQKPTAQIRAHSGLTDGDAPSCSTSPSTKNCQVSGSSFLNRSHPGSGTLLEDMVTQPANNLVRELQSKSDVRIKHQPPNMKEPEHLGCRGATTDPVDASSSATSYCLDGLTPEALMSRRFGSGKDLHNLVSGYGGTSQRDIETEISTAAISSQSFGATDMSFKPSCSGDGLVNDNGILNSGLWANQTPQQRMRTFTKVQKRGSVGRSIDITRYKEYEELRYDLAQMFGIEGQLEESQRSEWKLVYVDHENDILLVGDDLWEEFVSCVQSIKILSSAEVQQLSLDGDLGNVPAPNQTCSGSGSGNAWKGQYDEHSAAASFES